MKQPMTAFNTALPSGHIRVHESSGGRDGPTGSRIDARGSSSESPLHSNSIGLRLHCRHSGAGALVRLGARSSRIVFAAM
jgi:hypothetical protein